MAGVYERDGAWLAVPRPIPLAQLVRGAILNALAYTDGRHGAAAALLGLSPRQMSYQLRQYHIPTDTAHRCGRPRRLRLAARRRTA